MTTGSPLARMTPAIYRVRGVPVMLDADLAAALGMETKRFNEAIRRHVEAALPGMMQAVTRTSGNGDGGYVFRATDSGLRMGVAFACHAAAKGRRYAYLSHLLGVASLAIEYAGDEDDVIAAMLHDAVEDCGGLPMLEQIKTKFGNTVGSTVEQCSDSVTVDADAKSDWIDRKRAYVASVAGKSERARFVTTCDKLHNATAILNDHRAGRAADGTTVWDRFGGKTPEQVVAYYSAMVAALKGRVKEPLWQRLADTVTALEAVAKTDGHAHWLAELQRPLGT